MADLGRPTYIDVNAGVRPVDENYKARSVATGLGLANTVINEGVKRSVHNDVIEQINESLAASAEAAGRPAYDPIVPGSRQAHLAKRIPQLQAAIDQGTRSQQVAAEQAIRSIYQEAGQKYPWLLQEFDRMLGRSLSSAQMGEIAMHDDLRDQFADTAQADLDRIVKFAQEKLHIDTTLSPHDPYFQRLYAERFQMYETEQMSIMQAGAATANILLDVHDDGQWAQLKETTMGRTGAVQTKLTNFLLESNILGIGAELDKGDGADLRAVNNWATSKGVILRAQLEGLRTEMIQQFAVDDTLQQAFQTDKGKILKGLVDAKVEAIDRSLALLDNVEEGLPGAVDAFRDLMVYHTQEAWNTLEPYEKRFHAFYASPVGESILEIANFSNNPAGTTLKKGLSVAAQTMMARPFPELFDPSNPLHTAYNKALAFNTSGALNIQPGVSPDAILRFMDSIFVNPKESFIMPTDNSQQQQVLALHTKDLHEHLLTNGLNVVDKAAPEFASNSLLGMTYSLQYLNNDFNKPANIQADVLNTLANPQLLKAIDISLEDTNASFHQAWGLAARRYYNDTKPDAVIDRTRDHLRTTKVGGESLHNLVRIDIDALQQDSLVWTVDEEARARAVERALVLKAQNRVPGQTAAEYVDDQIRTLIPPIMNIVKQQIAIETAIERALADNKDQVKNQGFGHMFVGEGDGRSGRWANIFRYTEGTGSWTTE